MSVPAKPATAARTVRVPDTITRAQALQTVTQLGCLNPSERTGELLRDGRTNFYINDHRYGEWIIRITTTPNGANHPFCYRCLRWGHNDHTCESEGK